MTRRITAGVDTLVMPQRDLGFLAIHTPAQDRVDWTFLDQWIDSFRCFHGRLAARMRRLTMKCADAISCYPGAAVVLRQKPGHCRV